MFECHDRDDAPVEIVFCESFQFNTDWQSALKLRQHVRWFDVVESSTANEEDVICVDISELGAHNGSFNDR